MSKLDLPNIVFVVFDTLRKDAVQPYGRNVSTPTFERMASTGTCFDNVISTSNWTIPSHASFFTGKYPQKSGIHRRNAFRDIHSSNSLKGYTESTLAEILHKEGYQTTGISANFLISHLTGFDRGFDTFYETWPADFSDLSEKVNKLFPDNSEGEWRAALHKKDILFSLLNRRKFNGLIALAKVYREYLRRYRNLEKMNFPIDKGGKSIITLLHLLNLEDPFFLFLNFMEMHAPYNLLVRKRFWDTTWRRYKQNDTFQEVQRIVSRENLEDNQRKLISEGYFRSSNYIDSLLASLISLLKEKKKDKNTVFVVTSDHGEALFENNFLGHGFFLYDEIISLPLVISGSSQLKIKNNGRYVNNNDLYHIIKSIGEQVGQIEVGSPKTFSESFSGISKYNERVLADKFPNNTEVIDYMNSPRKAIFNNGYKLTLNEHDRNIEEFMKNGKKINLNEHKEIANELVSEIEQEYR